MAADGPAPAAPATLARRGELALTAVLLVALPLSTAAQEIACGVLLAWALVRRGPALVLGRDVPPLLPPALALAFAWVVASVASGDLHEGFGHAWLLAPLLAVRPLGDASRAGARLVRLGLYAAAAAGAWAVAQALGGEAARAGFSHHLTLAYALLPPFAVALARREWPAAAVIAAGVAATGSRGALPAVLAVLAATPWARPTERPAAPRRLLSPPVALAAGAALTVALLAVAAPADDLRQRAILWTGSLSLVGVAPVGPGAYPRASEPVYDRLEPGFYFPNHAHDAAAQVLVVVGPLGLAATAWLAHRLLTRTSPAAAAGVAGVLVGALTQDVLGDLEVIRAALVWAAVLALP